MSTLLLAGSAGCGGVEDLAPADASMDGRRIEAPTDTPVDAGFDAPLEAEIEDGTDAAIDAVPDVDSSVQYDVGYVDEVTLTPQNTALFGFAVVVNTGTTALQIQSTSVDSYGDDNPAVDWRLDIAEPAATMTLAPGQAAGKLIAAATHKLVLSGLVTEPIVDHGLFFAMSFPTTPPPAGITFKAQAVLRIDGKDITLPFTVHVVDTGSVVLGNVKRLHSRP